MQFLLNVPYGRKLNFRIRRLEKKFYLTKGLTKKKILQRCDCEAVAGRQQFNTVLMKLPPCVI